MVFVQIAEFNWLPGGLKVYTFRKKLNNYLLRNHKVDEADTFHTCL